MLAIALLGLEGFSGLVRQAFGRGLIDPMVMGYDSFRRDLGRTLADPTGRVTESSGRNHGPIVSTELLGGCH